VSSFARLARLPLRLLPRTAGVPILSGALRGKRWVVGAATHGCWLGTFERRTQAVFRNLVKRDGVVFDIGANVGFFTLLASCLVGPRGKVVAFEPVPRNVGMLRRHLEMNGIENVDVRQVAVSDVTGIARMRTLHSNLQWKLAPEGDIEVETVALDDLWSTAALPRPDVVKMDIEGAEAGALAGAARLLAEAMPVLVLSAHGWEQYERCRLQLSRAGYEFDPIRDGSGDGGYEFIGRPGPPRAGRRENQ
jgi:FkbM family methyltransferase